MSLDKVESSNPILTAAHAGASTGKTGHLQPNASDVTDAEGRLFCVSQTRLPHSSTLQVGGKARFASQNNHFRRSAVAGTTKCQELSAEPEGTTPNSTVLLLLLELRIQASQCEAS